MMRNFAETFFRHFGAHVSPHEDEWVVNLPPDLADVFGKPRLYLVFPEQDKTRDLSPAEDLLVYGSRTFDQMLSLLKDRGEGAYLHLPIQVSPPVQRQHFSPLPLHNCRVRGSYIASHQELFYIFNFRAVFVSDEKREKFVTVVLDEQGGSRPETLSMFNKLDVDLLPTFQPPEFDPQQLRHMLDRANVVARERAEDEAAELEGAIRPRLEKVLLRLTRYYRRLMDEVRSDDPAQDEAVRADLEHDLKRQTADELERHRLRVTLSPISYAIAHVPLARHRLTLATRHSQQTVELEQDLYTGQVVPISCHHCQEPIARLALCDQEHVVHPDCLSTCCRCDRDTCRTCGIQQCAVCNRPICADCVAYCVYGDSWLCAEHVRSCAICGKAHCPDHSFRCRLCDQTYCFQHNSRGECDTCRAALASLPVETVTVPAVAGLEASRYRWQRAENEAFVIYVGRRWLWRRLILVVDKRDQVLQQKEIGPLQRLLQRWILPPPVV